MRAGPMRREAAAAWWHRRDRRGDRAAGGPGAASGYWFRSAMLARGSVHVRLHPAQKSAGPAHLFRGIFARRMRPSSACRQRNRSFEPQRGRRGTAGALAGVPDGSGGARDVHGLGLRLRRTAGYPAVAGTPMACRRRSAAMLGGIAMGLTAVCIISSPWGQRSGAHMNPALDADLSVARQDRAVGRALLYRARSSRADWPASLICRVAHRAAASRRGRQLCRDGARARRAVGRVRGRVRDLVPADHDRPERLELAAARAVHAVVAGTLVATYISIESPLSGMSMNPARTVGIGAPVGNLDCRLGLLRWRQRSAMLAAGADLPALARRASRLLRQAITTTTTSAASSAATSRNAASRQ